MQRTMNKPIYTQNYISKLLHDKKQPLSLIFKKEKTNSQTLYK